MEQNLTSTLALLAATPPSLDALLRHLPEALTHVSEGPGTWTVAQVLAHLIHGERTDWLPRVQILLRAGESETFPTFQREAHLGDSRPAARSADRVRRSTLRQPRPSCRPLHLTPEDLERRGRHPAFGTVTLSQLLATWPAHDLTHLHQISRILASQYREAVGPWSRYLGVLHCDGHSGQSLKWTCASHTPPEGGPSAAPRSRFHAQPPVNCGTAKQR